MNWREIIPFMVYTVPDELEYTSDPATLLPEKYCAFGSPEINLMPFNMALTLLVSLIELASRLHAEGVPMYAA